MLDLQAEHQRLLDTKDHAAAQTFRRRARVQIAFTGVRLIGDRVLRLLLVRAGIEALFSLPSG